MAKQIIHEVRDAIEQYTATAVARPRMIMPGYQFYVEIQRDKNTVVKKVEIGKMGPTMGSFFRTYEGVYGIRDMRFNKFGLTIDFLRGSWGRGLDGILIKEQKFVPRDALAL